MHARSWWNWKNKFKNDFRNPDLHKVFMRHTSVNFSFGSPVHNKLYYVLKCVMPNKLKLGKCSSCRYLVTEFRYWCHPEDINQFMKIVFGFFMLSPLLDNKNNVFVRHIVSFDFGVSYWRNEYWWHSFKAHTSGDVIYMTNSSWVPYRIHSLTVNAFS